MNDYLEEMQTHCQDLKNAYLTLFSCTQALSDLLQDSSFGDEKSLSYCQELLHTRQKTIEDIDSRHQSFDEVCKENPKASHMLGQLTSLKAIQQDIVDENNHCGVLLEEKKKEVQKKISKLGKDRKAAMVYQSTPSATEGVFLDKRRY